MKRFLLIKTSALGDIIHAYPIVNYLRSRFPDATIDWVVEESGSPLVQAHPMVSHTLKICTHRWRKNLGKWSTWKEICTFVRTLRKESYDAVFDLQGNVKSGILTGLTKAQMKIGFGKVTVPEWPNIFFTTHRYNPPAGRNIVEDNLFLVQQFFQDATTVEISPVKLQIPIEQQNVINCILSQSELIATPRLMICPGSAWFNKQMSEEALLDFMQRIKKHNNCSFLLVWGSTQEKALTERLQAGIGADCFVIPKLPLPTLQNLMEKVDVVISMDSLALHLAASVGTPTFSIFGASLANKYAPLGSQNFAIQGNCPYGRTFEKRCPILRKCLTGLCIKSLSGKEIFEAFLRACLK